MELVLLKVAYKSSNTQNPKKFPKSSEATLTKSLLLTLNLKLNYYYGTVKINKKTF